MLSANSTGAPEAVPAARAGQTAMGGWLTLCVISLTVYLCASHAVREFLREAARLLGKL